THGITSSPAVADGKVFVGSNDHFLYVFPAAGCGSSVCDPLFTGQATAAIQTAITVDNGLVYVGTFDNRLEVFDANGCPTSPCQPLWVGRGRKLLPGSPRGFNSPAISNGFAYVTSNAGQLYAFPAAGCGAATCRPVWAGTTQTL